MYSIGQIVVYGIHGVCKIIDKQDMRVDKKNTKYFVLEPLDQPGAKFFVPCDNESALAKLRPILSKQELDHIIGEVNNTDSIWISDENQRKQKYRELIGGGDRAALLCMIRSLYEHKREQIAAGRKFHLCDENFLHDAEKLLSTEFALVLGINTDEVGIYIQSKVNSL